MVLEASAPVVVAVVDGVSLEASLEESEAVIIVLVIATEVVAAAVKIMSIQV